MARTIIRTTPKGAKRSVKKWKPDPKIKGAVLIPVDEALEAIGIRVSPRVLDNTVVRRRAESDDLSIGLVTTMPDGLRVAWDNCGRCHQHVTNCMCREGVYHPSSIAWIRSKTEEWMGGSEHVVGRYFEPTVRTMRESTSMAPRTFTPSRPVRASVDPETVLDDPVDRKTRSSRQRPAQAVADTSDIDNLDLKKLGLDAMASAERYTSVFDDLLNNDNDKPKRVIKRGKKSS